VQLFRAVCAATGSTENLPFRETLDRSQGKWMGFTRVNDVRSDARADPIAGVEMGQ